jgi:hypothetical protein
MLDFRPDLDPRTPGYLAFVSELVPTDKGYLSPLAEVPYPDTGSHTYTLIAGEVWPNVCFASRWNSQPGGIVIAGTNKKLNIINFDTGYIDVSRPGGYSLGGTPSQYGEDTLGAFDICAFGDLIIACNKAVTAQKRNALDLTGATKFSDLGGATAAPTARVCCAAANFVFLGDVGNYSTVTGAQDILAWSAIGDHTDWRVDPQRTQCSFAQFVDTPGAITAVHEFQGGIVVFKANSMYRGRYVGAGPNSPVWDFERISDRVGCTGFRSVVNIPQGLVFVSAYDIYLYDGTQPRAITHGIKDFIRENQLFYDIFGRFILQLQRSHYDMVWFCARQMTLVWNYKLDRWGMLSTTQTTQPIPCRSNTQHFMKAQATTVVDGVPTVVLTPNWTDLDGMRLFDGVTMSRDAAVWPSSYLTTGVFGQPHKLSALSRVTPLLTSRPTTPPTAPPNMVLTVYGSKTPGSGTALGTVNMNEHFRFDTLAMSASTHNFFAFRLDATERIELVDLVPTLTPAGER